MLRPMESDTPRKRAATLSKVREVLETQGNVSGYAFVAWGGDGMSTAYMFCGPGSFPSIYAPDFVRNRLLALKVEEWTMDNFK